MKDFFKKIIDLFIPPTEGDLLLRSINYDDFMTQVKRASLEDSEEVEVIFDYHDQLIKTAIWEMKYRKNMRAVEFFSKALYERILDDVSDRKVFEEMDKYLLVPIPASYERTKNKGYNPPEMIAKKITELDKNGILKMSSALRKKSEVPKQTDIKNRTQRMANVKGVFEVRNAEEISDKVIFVIDDVSTTGATLKDARRALKKAGAKEVKLFAVAH